MLQIRCDPNQAELSGTPAELRALAAALEQLATAGGERLFRCELVAAPAPFLDTRRLLQLRHSHTADRIALKDDALVLSADTEGLRRLASYFAVLENAAPGAHAHHEYLPGDDYIAPDSLPLAIMVAPDSSI